MATGRDQLGVPGAPAIDALRAGVCDAVPGPATSAVGGAA
jgi:hypothetical protein